MENNLSSDSSESSSESGRESSQERNRKFSGLQVVAIVLIAMLLTVGITLWIVATDIFVSKFTPVTLNEKEQKTLSNKLKRISGFKSNELEASQQTSKQAGDNIQRLKPEAYSEKGANREIHLSEKELNAMLAKNTNLATQLAIDLSGNLVSAKYLLPLDEELPVLGGRTLKLTAGVELAFTNAKPSVLVKGISVWGVPLPNAWIGEIKNIDLVREYGDAGFWKAFAAGVENVKVDDGQLTIKLKP